MSWTPDRLTLRPDLIVCEPYQLEGTHTVAGTDKTLYLDHGWDNTFGYAFGTVRAVGAKVKEIAPGDLVHFTRHAYVSEIDENGAEWLFVNTEDCLAVIEVDANGRVEAEADIGLERDAA